MGCDIHLYVEKKTANGWEHVPAPLNWDSDELCFTDRPISDSVERYKRYGCQPRWFSDRNYELFAWLAGVRNYHNVTPVAASRGLPANMSAGVTREAFEWGCDGHSHSWLWLHEAAVPDDLKLPNGGVVSAEEYELWKTSGDVDPPGWCGGISGPGIRTVSEEEYLASKARAQLLAPPGKLFISCTWQSNASEYLRRFSLLTKALGEYCGPDTRIVFWFDN